MSTGAMVNTNAALREQLSALVDGELDAAAAAATCAVWRHEAEARASWHAYQLIGDVLRSDDLAAPPARDAAFLNALRNRLALEPVIVVPQPAPWRRAAEERFDSSGARAFANRRGLWKASSAVAAGFFAVAGVFMLTRSVEPTAPASATLARADAPLADSARADGLQRVGTVEPVAGQDPPSAAVLVPISNGKLIRDARLDSYLTAHKQFAGSSALGMPSAHLRSVTAEGPER